MRRFLTVLLAVMVAVIVTPSAMAEENEPAIFIASITGGSAVGQTWNVAVLSGDTIHVAWSGTDEGPFTVTLGIQTVETDVRNVSFNVAECGLTSGEYYLSIAGKNAVLTANLVLTVTEKSVGESAYPVPADPGAMGGLDAAAMMGSYYGMKTNSYGSRGGAGVPGVPSTAGGIVPGMALTTTHVSGRGDRSLYNSVELKPKNARMYKLTMGMDELDVQLASERPFMAVLSGENSLRLAAEESQPVWVMSLAALETLNRSGLGQIVAVIDDGSDVVIPTDLTFTGYEYMCLRREGPSLDLCMLIADANGMALQVGQERWNVLDGGILQKLR